jgi:hypothetical protein
VYFATNSVYEDEYRYRKEAIKGIEAVRAYVQYRVNLGHTWNNGVNVPKNWNCKFDQLVNEIMRLGQSGVADLAILYPRFEKWHAMTGPLSDAFITAMRTSNPDVDIGYSNEGPVSRFLAAVILRITGQAIKLSTIAQHLKRARNTSVS